MHRTRRHVRYREIRPSGSRLIKRKLPRSTQRSGSGVLVLALAVLGGLLVGCDGGSGQRQTEGMLATESEALSGGTVIEKRQRFLPIGSDCSNGSRHVFEAIDVSGSGRSGLAEARLHQAVSLLRTPALCGGRAKIVIFSRSLTDSAVVFDSAFPRPPGTETSRILQADKAIGEAATQAQQSLKAALPRLPDGGSDIVGQLSLVAEFQRGLPVGEPVAALLFTDGMQNVPMLRLPAAFQGSSPAALASAVAVPDLTDVRLGFVGIGRVAGAEQPLSSDTEALKSFFAAICQRSGATCVPGAVTDL